MKATTRDQFGFPRNAVRIGELKAEASPGNIRAKGRAELAFMRQRALSAMATLDQLKALMVEHERPALSPQCQMTEAQREQAASSQLTAVRALLASSV